MGKYKYSFVGEGVPLAPIIEVHLTNPFFHLENSRRKCKAFLDTGADSTLVPISLASKVNAKFIGRSTRKNLIGVGGASVTYIPCLIGILFEEKYFSNIQVLACDDNDLGKVQENSFYEILIGRDFLQYYKIHFDGPNLEFRITKAATLHPKAPTLAEPATLLRPQH